MASIGPLTFGPDGTLFAADNQGAAIFALDLGAQATSGAPGAKGLDALDEKLAALLGTGAREIAITDLAVHPKTRQAYVSAMGFALQTMTLWLLVRWAGVNASVAITLAVLAAVSHNFAWHETVTWPNLPAERRFRRWLYFQFSTGAISLLTNLGITMIVMTATGLSVVPSNVIAVVLASAASFWINDRVIFRPAPALTKSLDASSMSQGNRMS